MNDLKPLAVRTTPIPGLLLVDLPVHKDHRGWFKENWQREKMLEIGLPDFGPVQNNVSFNSSKGTTRGLHAEPWDKFISVVHGRVFGAWVDLRSGSTFGTLFTAELDESTAIFVPRGVANSFQTLEDNTVYSYLVNDHWTAAHQAQYTFVNLADPDLAINWPIPLEQAELSDADRVHPPLAAVSPFTAKPVLVIGANGQLGRALQDLAVHNNFSHWEFADRSRVDLFDRDTMAAVAWRQFGCVINAAGYTQVDAAETPEGRRDAWAVNASGVAALAQHCAGHGVPLVHISTDYVFDGKLTQHQVNESLSPLGVYGQSKAAGELAVRAIPKHYVIRTSWVIGEGANFVKTMARLARDGAHPSVVNDQFGRLTFASELARAVEHLVSQRAPFGVYHMSNSGDPTTWHAVAQRVFEFCGRDKRHVVGVSTQEYEASRAHTVTAPRPQHSDFDLSSLIDVGFVPEDQWQALDAYLRSSL